jgi:hypothetical protein
MLLVPGRTIQLCAVIAVQTKADDNYAVRCRSGGATQKSYAIPISANSVIVWLYYDLSGIYDGNIWWRRRIRTPVTQANITILACDSSDFLG